MISKQKNNSISMQINIANLKLQIISFNKLLKS